MAEFCGQCCKEMKALANFWEYGDFGYLLKELKKGQEATVLCEGCGWVTYKRVGRFYNKRMEVVKREAYEFN